MCMCMYDAMESVYPLCVQQRPELQLLLSVAGEEDTHVHVRTCTYAQHTCTLNVK